MYEALIARLRERADFQYSRDLQEAADALERIQKMQPEAWIELAGSVVPLYRFPIGEDK
jgi:hypothetical protein